MISRFAPSFCLLTHLFAVANCAADDRSRFTLITDLLRPPEGSVTIGDAHGDIAVSPAGDIYVSIQGGNHPGIQVYSADGRYLHNVQNAPNDVHGFTIATARDGTPSIFAVSLGGQKVIQLTLHGKVLMTIPNRRIPDEYKTLRDGKLSIYLTGVAVSASGDIYAVDGYGRDFIHRFDQTGRYIGTFGGGGEPWHFKQCHQIAIDVRFDPARLLCTDRLHGRVIHMDLDGQVLGVVAEGLRWPSALAIYKDELAVAELEGRVSILGLKGQPIAVVGANDNEKEIRTNEVPPQMWRPSAFHAPHGITYDATGNMLVTEWSKWGRVVYARRN